MNFGWFLPYNPQIGELGAWKMHYIDCILNISSSPLKKVIKINFIFNFNKLIIDYMLKTEANKYRDIVYKRELNDREKEDVIYRTTKRELTQEQNCN
jgi:hypothetical protein